MIRWLDQPVPSYPWYSSDGAFYQQRYPQTTFYPYREYYAAPDTPGVNVGRTISNPTSFDISQRTPANVYYAAGQGLPYSQYASIAPSRANDLWIQGSGNWSQYAVVPVGTRLQLIANVSEAGPGGLYEINQTDKATLVYNTLQFNQGYNIMSLNANQVGRHMFYYVVNNQPSDVVVVDVFSQAQ